MYRIRNPHTKFISSEILIRSIDDTAYPEQDLSLPKGHYSYGKAELFDFYHNGLVVYTFPYSQEIIIRQPRLKEGKGFLFQTVRATVLGYIPYNNIIDYDIDGDEYYNYPHVFCDFGNGIDPFEYIRYALEDDTGCLHVFKDDEVAEISKTERVDHINSLRSVDYKEYDDYCGRIICSDCGKELTVDRNTDIYDGAWGVYPVMLETLEIGEEKAVCYDCYPNHCLKAGDDDWEQLRNLEKAIEEATDFVSGSKELETVHCCLSKLRVYSIKEDTLVTKDKIVYHLNSLLKVTGTPNFNAAVTTLTSWFKAKLQ